MVSWFKRAIIYQIFIDRFAGYKEDCNPGTDVFCGGNIDSIINKLDYIKNLGANTIWLSPFYKTSAYHGYHITDFNNVDSHFGSLEDLKCLIQTCKQKHIKLIADIVPNHCSNKHPWFIDAQLNRNSKFRNWFYFDTNNKYLNFMGYNELPKLNLENQETSEWMINNIVTWAKLGFDSYRIDHVLGIPDRFLIRLRHELKKTNPNFVLIGEAWGDGMKKKFLKTLRFKGRYKLWKHGFKQISLQKHYEGILDGVLDFEWRNILLNNFELVNKNPTKLETLFSEYNNEFKEDFFLPRFLDNHDTARILQLCKNNNVLFLTLLKTLFQQKQPIILYYGTESGLKHIQDFNAKTPHSDLLARGVINWGHSKQAFYENIQDLANHRKKQFASNKKGENLK